MNPKVADLFVEASEMPPEDREAYLAEACGEDAELRLEVQRMLVDAERADSYFGEADQATLAADGSGQTSGKKATPSSSPAPLPPEPVTEKEGDVIGPYKLLQPIGEGGFGTVWMAEQSEPITRRVALKVIKAGMDTREVLARFEAERQALAMMDHPNIAKVLDAGATPTGRPWFAMELVKGIPITQFCDEAELGTKERLALFGDVCSAINHAHQKGVIHRDIKPNNVMVTLYADKPVVKVIDFGIAKATQGKLTDQTLFTRFEQFIGTPVYMSPEQAALSAVDIDTRSDIYALGILLYELLVGKPPFDSKSLVSAGYDEMRRIIREVEPEKPSSRLGTIAGEERTLLAKTHRIEEWKLNKLVEPDLDWIVMKAIDKDRTRRYETAKSLADDLQRHLANEPVSARPPSSVYRLQKAWRRNKLLCTSGTVVVAALVIGLVASVLALVGQDRAIEAERKAVRLQKAAELSEARAESTGAVVAGMIDEAIPTLLEQDNRTGAKVLMDSAVDMVSKHLEDSPIVEFRVRKAMREQFHRHGMWQLEEASEHNRRMAELLPRLTEEKMPASERRLNEISIAGVRAAYDDFDGGTRDLQAIRRELSSQTPLPEDLIIETLIMEGDANNLAGQNGEAERLFKEACALDPEMDSTLSLTGEGPTPRLTNILLLQGKFAEAVPHARGAFDIRPADSGPRTVFELASRVVQALCGAGRSEDAEQFIGEQEPVTSSWAEEDRLRWELLMVQVRVAQGHWQEAAERLIGLGLREDASCEEWRLGVHAAKLINDSEAHSRLMQRSYEFLATADTESAYWLIEVLARQPRTEEVDRMADFLRKQLQNGRIGWWTPLVLLADARRSIDDGRYQEALDAVEKFVNYPDLRGVAAMAHRRLIATERHQYIRAVALAGLVESDSSEEARKEAREAFLAEWNQERSGVPVGSNVRGTLGQYLSQRNSRHWASAILTAKGIELPEEALIP